MKKQNIIDNFVRYHPILRNANLMKDWGHVLSLGKTIAIDLTSEEIIYNNINPKCKNKIRKASKNGVHILHGKGIALFDEFMNIYNATMDKDNADSYYYFKRDFFKSIHQDLNENYEMFYAVYNGTLIAMSIFLFANGQMHYHLSGSLPQFSYLAPTNLLLYKAALWGVKQGFKTLHLGGGLGSNEDNLYKFKLGFNKYSNYTFSIGKEIYNEKIYDQLVRDRKMKDNAFDLNSSFFPLYRS